MADVNWVARVRDYFTRNSTNTWGNTDTGHVWRRIDNEQPTTGTGFQVSESATKAKLNLGANYGYLGAFVDWGPTNGEVLARMVIPNDTTSATGVSIGKFKGQSAFYEITWVAWEGLRVRIWPGGLSNPGQVVRLALNANVSVTPGQYHWFRVALGSDNVIRAKVWQANATAEPGWQINVNADSRRTQFACPGIFGYSGALANNMTIQTFYAYNHADMYTHNLPVVDEFDTLTFRGLGQANATHEWWGDATYRPEWYAYNVSSGTPAFNVLSGRNRSFAEFNFGTGQTGRYMTNLISFNGSGNTTVETEVDFKETNQYIRLILAGAVSASGGRHPLQTTTWPCVGLNSGASGAWIQAGAASYRFGQDEVGTIQPGTVYVLKGMQRNSRVYVKAWVRGQPEPSEWLGSRPMESGVLTSGSPGFSVYSPVVGSINLARFEATATSVQPRLYSSARMDMDTSLSVNAVVVAKQDSVSASVEHGLSANPIRAIRDTMAAASDSDLTAASRMRYNTVGSIFGTRVVYVPNINSVTNMVANARRRILVGFQGTADTTISAAPKLRAYRSATLNMDTALSYYDQVRPTVKVDMHAQFTLVADRVVTKRSGATAGATFGMTWSEVRRTNHRANTMAMDTTLYAKVPGTHIEEFKVSFTTGMEWEARISILDQAILIFTHDAIAEPEVWAVHLGDSRMDQTSSMTATGYLRYRVDALLESEFNLTTSEVRRTDHSADEMTFTTSLTVDRPDFEIIYEDVIAERVNFIYYACTKMTMEPITIEYRHRRTMDASSTTYFIARDRQRTPVLFGYSINKWDDRMIIVHVTGSYENEFMDRITAEFGLKESDAVG